MDNIFQRILNIKYNVPYAQTTNDLFSVFSVPERIHLPSTALIEPLKFNLPSECYILSNYNLASKVQIPYYSLVDFEYRLIQAPILEKFIYPTQDSYTREAKPTMNYAKSATLLVGNALEGQYQTFIQFDITQLNSLVNIFYRSLNVVLDISSNLPQTIDVYEVITEWSENTITWNNSPIVGEKIVTMSGTDILKVDLQEYIENKLKNGSSTISICIKSDHVFFIASKDSPNKPYIDVKYSDATWNGFLGTNSLYSTAKKRLTAIKELFTVADITLPIDLVSTVYMKNPRDLLCKVLIASPDLMSKLKIRYSKDYLFTAKVRKAGAKNLESKGHIIKSYIESNVDIKQVVDLACNVYCKRYDDDYDLYSSVRVIRTSLFSKVKVGIVKELASSLVVRRTANQELDSTVHVIRTALKSSVDIFCNKDLYAQAIRRKTEFLDLVSSGRSIRTFIYSNATLRYSKDLLGTVNIFPTVDLKSAVAVRHSKSILNKVEIKIPVDLPSILQVRYSKILRSNSSIRYCKNLFSNATLAHLALLRSKANIYRVSNLLSKLDITKAVTLDSRVSIKQSTDLKSKVTLQYYLGLQSSATTKILCEMPSKANITRSRDILSFVDLFRYVDISSNTIIRHFNILNSSANLFRIVDIPSTSTVSNWVQVRCSANRYRVKPLHSVLKIRKKTTQDGIPSEVYLNGYYTCMMAGEMKIRVKEYGFMRGTVVIRTDAKEYNQQSNNLKYPRVWKREDHLTDSYIVALPPKETFKY